jgi:hypothetical protein
MAMNYYFLTTNSIVEADNYLPMGCHEEYTSPTIFTPSDAKEGVISIAQCFALCYFPVYNFFGLRNSICYCGGSLSTSPVPATTCNINCSSSGNCGGINSINVFQITSIVLSLFFLPR